MRFPKESREGTEGHSDARDRLDEARDHQRDLHRALEASKDTPGERAAAADLAAATAQTAAREAWLTWAERDYN
jgi:hypothetical protein